MGKTRSVSSDDCGLEEPNSPFANTSGTDRKRRRGVIEKRRRDRINCSLYDLKRLVPDMTRKPGSSKLEKAEILQATVDFIQRLYREGHVLGCEARAIELRRTGFKECMLEVTRLLANFQGINVHYEEVRQTILTHLQQYERQRDADAKIYLANIAAVAHALDSQRQKLNLGIPHPVTAAAANPWVCQPSDPCAQGSCDSSRGQSYSHHNHYDWESSSQQYTVAVPQYPQSAFINQTGSQLMNPVGRQHENSSIKHKPQSSCLQHNQTDVDFHAQFTSPSQMNHTPFNSLTNPGVNAIQVPNVLGPNESQSTSSPPFQSTPDDTELMTSPHLFGKMLGSNEGRTECSSLENVQTAPQTTSMLAQLHNRRDQPSTSMLPEVSGNRLGAVHGCGNQTGNARKLEPLQPTAKHSDSRTGLEVYPTAQPYEEVSYGSTQAYPSSSREIEVWNKTRIPDTDSGYLNNYWQYSFQAL
ncbi:unnamed protein product [Dicrocoelium dendriticum]|nr:unnamed protein product [Dicrocoelium dendriticum]